MDGVNLAVLVSVAHPTIEGEQQVVACVQTAPHARPDDVRRALERRYAVMGAARPDHTLFMPIALAGRSRKPDRARVARDASTRLATRP